MESCYIGFHGLVQMTCESLTKRREWRSLSYCCAWPGPVTSPSPIFPLASPRLHASRVHTSELMGNCVTAD